MAHRLPEKKAADVPLRVLPRGTALVQDYRALRDTGTNRFIGWRWDGSLGPEFTIKDAKGQDETRRHGGRVKRVDEVMEISSDDPHRHEYIKHLRHGDLWAADEATARAAAVPFEPHFLGEHPQTSAKSGLDSAKLVAKLKDLGVEVEANVDVANAIPQGSFEHSAKPESLPKPVAVAVVAPTAQGAR